MSFPSAGPGQRLRFDPSRAAILVVDMLNEFLEPGGEMVLLEGRRIIEPINRLLAAAARWECASSGSVMSTRSPEDREFQKRVPHCLAGHLERGDHRRHGCRPG